MPDLLERREAGISFGLEGLTPSMALPPSPSALVDDRLYFGAEAAGPVYWPGRRRKAWVEEIAGRITRLSALSPGWDGQRARPIDRQTLLQVWRFVEGIADVVVIPPSMVPTVSGGVALEWHRNGVDLEIDFSGGTPTVSYEDTDGIEAEGPLVAHVDVVAAALGRIR